MNSKDSDQTGRMPRLICVFNGQTDHFVGFVVLWYNYEKDQDLVLPSMVVVPDTSKLSTPPPIVSSGDTTSS